METHDYVMNFTTTLRKAMHNTFRYGQGTRDLSGPEGFNTEQFVEKVAWRLDRYLTSQMEDKNDAPTLGEPSRSFRRNHCLPSMIWMEMVVLITRSLRACWWSSWEWHPLSSRTSRRRLLMFNLKMM